jgi:putative membrane protein
MDGLRAFSAVLSALHLLALAAGAPAIVLRGRALKGPMDDAHVARATAADNFWGMAGLLWIATGLMRAFGGFEKGAAYYLHNPLFHAKLGLVALLLLLEIYPAATLIRWRLARARGAPVDTSSARTLFVINHVQVALVGVIVFVAAFMARWGG